MNTVIDKKAAFKNRNTIAVLGGKLYEMELKRKKGKRILKSDLEKIKQLLSDIDTYDKSIWEQIKNQNP